jgi:hypothetical protein
MYVTEHMRAFEDAIKVAPVLTREMRFQMKGKHVMFLDGLITADEFKAWLLTIDSVDALHITEWNNHHGVQV